MLDDISSLPETKVCLEEWPEVPKSERPRRVAHNGQFSAALVKLLAERGWELVHVKLLAGAEAVRLTLEGMRLGTIDVTQNAIRALELEARIHGLLNKEPPQPKEKKVMDGDVEQLLMSIGTTLNKRNIPGIGNTSDKTESKPKE
jgi:hypothetical protein